jgi:hypothetical protein
MTEATFKQELEVLALRRFELPEGLAAFSILDAHLDSLGSLDPRLRDSLFYEAADTWIGGGLLSQDQLSSLTARLLSPAYLFKGLGAEEGPDVFRRTFSALILDAIVRGGNASGDADPARPTAIALGLERYAREERDLRGFVPPFGWAHAAAHAADVLASLMACKALIGWDGRLLEAARQLLLRSGTVFTHQEDKRLARVAAAHRHHHPDQKRTFEDWIEDLVAACPVSYSEMARYARHTNVLGLLRALYFYLHRDPGEAATAAWLEAKVGSLMRIP